jgi:hypothetical protein
LNVYQASDGQWIFFDDITKHFFATQQEAQNMASKANYGSDVQAQATEMAEMGKTFQSMVANYFDRGYNVGGSDPIIDDDIASTGMTAAEMADMITLAQQFANFLDNAAVTQADYSSTLNKIRTGI